MLQNPHVLLTFEKVHSTIPCACHAKRHLNVQKWSEPLVALVFLTCWLRNVLRATTACTCSTSQLPKVVRTWSVFSFFTSKCASRHNGVHFFISHLASGSAPAALASLLFDPPEPQIIGKTQCFATFLPFRASAFSFFWLFLFSHLLSSTLLFSLTLPISAVNLSILSEVWLLNFLRSYFIIFFICTMHTTCKILRVGLELSILAASTGSYHQVARVTRCKNPHIIIFQLPICNYTIRAYLNMHRHTHSIY